MTTTTRGVSADPVAVAVQSIHTMAAGDRAAFDPLYDPRAIDQENRIQPPAPRPGTGRVLCHCPVVACRVRRPALRHPPRDHRRQPGGGQLDDERPPRRTLGRLHRHRRGRHGLPPTYRSFATTQSHWFRIEDGRIVEHWANRDDLGTARQLGWIPPTPAYLLKMMRAKRRHT